MWGDSCRPEMNPLEKIKMGEHSEQAFLVESNLFWSVNSSAQLSLIQFSLDSNNRDDCSDLLND